MPDLFYLGRMDAVQVAVSYAVATDLTDEAIRIHDCDPRTAHVLGRALCAGVLATASLNANERLNICWRYRGLIKTVLVDAGPDGTARGMVVPAHLSDQELTVAEMMGDGAEVQVITSEHGKIINSGTVETLFQDPVADLSFFYATSHQIETETNVVIAFQPDVEHPVAGCYGLLLQALPDCDLEVFQKIRDRMQDPTIRELLATPGEPKDHLQQLARELTRDIVENPGLSITRTGTPRFHCDCTRDKMGAVLRTLPYPERMDMVRAGKDITIRCHFCNKAYILGMDECIKEWNIKPAEDAPKA